MPERHARPLRLPRVTDVDELDRVTHLHTADGPARC